MEKLGNIKFPVRAEERCPCKFAFTVFVVAVNIPYRIGAVCVRAQIVRNIAYNKLGFRWYVVNAKILEIIVV
jgi:hypothetical protein